jgi:UDP-N-acetylglucosamine:LPS N-acetylglucosamine transferase
MQEAGNVPYVEDGGFGVYAFNKPKKIATLVYNLFQDEAKLHKMSVRATELSRPGATRAIAKDVGAIVMRSSEKTPTFNDTL